MVISTLALMLATPAPDPMKMMVADLAFAQQDRDRNGRLDRAELTHAAGWAIRNGMIKVKGEATPAKIDAKVDELLERYDADGDGLSRQEMRALVRAEG